VAAGRIAEDLEGGQLVARLQGAESLLAERSLVSQLDDVDATGQRRFGELRQVVTLAPGISAEVQLRRCQPGPGCGVTHTANANPVPT